MLAGGFVAAQYPRWSDHVVASCMTAAALCMALCASGLFGVTGTLVHLVNALKALVGKRNEAITGLELNSTNFYNHGNGGFRLRLPYRPRGWARW